MANIPSPIVGAGGAQRQNPLIALLLSLAGSAGQAGISKLLQGNPPQQQLAQQNVDARASLERSSSDALMGQPGTPEAAAVRSAAASGAGNANVPNAQVAGLGALSSLRASAPERLGVIQQQQAALQEQNAVTQRQLKLDAARAAREQEAEARMQKRFLGTIRKQNPELVGVAEMLWNASKGGGVDTSAMVQTGILPQTEKQRLDEALAGVQLDEARLSLRRLRSDTALRQEVAAALGLQADTVTDSMISQWSKAKDPKALEAELITTLVSRGIIDPLTGQAHFLDMDEVAGRAEAGLQLIIPGYRLNMTPELRQMTEAAGILEAAVTREKMKGDMEDDALLALLKPKFLQDFPQLDEATFNILFTRALKANLLSGLTK